MASSSEAMDVASDLLGANSTDWSLLATLSEAAIRALIRAVELVSASENSIIFLEPQRNVRRGPASPARLPVTGNASGCGRRRLPRVHAWASPLPLAASRAALACWIVSGP